MATMKAAWCRSAHPHRRGRGQDLCSRCPATAIKAATDVAEDDMILDIGPETAARLEPQLKSAGTIVWNGPVGVFEFAASCQRHRSRSRRSIAASDAFSIAGGGRDAGSRSPSTAF